jgi:hypothetical protein
MTGWNWDSRCSIWVALDYDAITGHATGLSEAQLREIQERACAVDWVTVRRSTSGRGLHLYVQFDPPIPTANHNEHAELARWTMLKLSECTAFDFQAGVDTCGGNMWLWHRKMNGSHGLKLVKQGSPFTDVPHDWRNCFTVGRRRTKPQVFTPSDRDRLFDELTGKHVPLDADHRRLIDWLDERRTPCSWNEDQQKLVTHTYWLKEAHKALGLRGRFETVSTGRNKDTDINCFAFPLRRGAWVVRRYTQGVAEAATWDKDKAGWTHCYLNREPRAAGRGAAFSFTLPLEPFNEPRAGD